MKGIQIQNIYLLNKICGSTPRPNINVLGRHNITKQHNNFKLYGTKYIKGPILLRFSGIFQNSKAPPHIIHLKTMFSSVARVTAFLSKQTHLWQSSSEGCLQSKLNIFFFFLIPSMSVSISHQEEYPIVEEMISPQAGFESQCYDCESCATQTCHAYSQIQKRQLSC